MIHADHNKVIAVLDWELSTLGHPLADLAYFCMGLRLPTTPLTHGLMGVDREPLGIPSEEAIVQRYCELRGIDEIEHWSFYLAFSFFRLAAIAQGVYKRALDGNASNENAMKTGDTVVGLAQLAMVLVRGEH
jgi:aminoglycoside phosphotransferase (APT) family kinase protein